MKRVSFGTSWILFVSAILAGAAFGQQGVPDKPLVTYYERNPWLMVIGSESPIFALYDSGIVIYDTKGDNPIKRYQSTRLTDESLKKLLIEFNLTSRLSEFDRKLFKASEASDQPKNEIFYWVNGELHGMGIYGSLRDKEIRKNIPVTVLEAYDAIVQFRSPDSKPWLPPVIEVMIRPFEHSREKPKVWPTDWPGLNHPMTKKRGNSFSLYSESKNFKEFLELKRNLDIRQAVLIDNRKWSVNYRIPFPGEY